MLSVYCCIGFLNKEPKEIKAKNGRSTVSFNLMIKRSQKSEYDILNFRAYGHDAEYILKYFHVGDCVSVQARPKLYTVPDKRGVQKKMITFEVLHADYVCKTNKLMIDEFGMGKIAEMEEIFKW